MASVPLLQRLVPVSVWAPHYRRDDLRGDLAAGLTVGAMLVPQSLAYALLAGLPPETGLYASIVPVVVYALLGTSRQLAVGPVALTSLLTAGALAPIAAEGTAEYVAAAAALALIVGVIHLGLGALRLGFLVNFLSHSVLVGFTAGAAVIIGFSQFKHLLGISVDRKDVFVETIGEYLSALDGTHGLTVVMGVGAIIMLIGLKRFAPVVPAALVVVAVTTVVSALFGLEDRGVKVVGDIPDSLPGFGLPDLGDGLVADLAGIALVITVVGFLESVAIAKVYARRQRYEVDANQELIALGTANVGAGLFAGYPVTGGFSRTAVNAGAGANTPLASLITALSVLLTVLLFTPLFAELPKATLGAIVVVAVAGLVDIDELMHLAKVDRADFGVAVFAFVATLAIGIELGIAAAVAASVIVVLARQARPHTAELGRVPGTRVYRNRSRFPEVETDDRIVVVRIDASLTFVNATFLRPRIERLLAEHPAVEAVVIAAQGINSLDASAEQALGALLDDLDARGIELHFASIKGPVRDTLISSGLWDRLGVRLHAGVAEAVDHLSGREPQEPTTTDGRRRLGVDERSS